MISRTFIAVILQRVRVLIADDQGPTRQGLKA